LNVYEYSKETDRKGIKSKHGDVSKNRTHSESEHGDRKGTKSKHGDVSKSRMHSDVENSDRKSTKSKHILRLSAFFIISAIFPLNFIFIRLFVL
jgi:hypothetical protein